MRAFVERGEILFPAARLRHRKIRVGCEARDAAGMLCEVRAKRTVPKLRGICIGRERDGTLADERVGEKFAVWVALVKDDG